MEHGEDTLWPLLPLCIHCNIDVKFKELLNPKIFCI